MPTHDDNYKKRVSRAQLQNRQNGRGLREIKVQAPSQLNNYSVVANKKEGTRCYYELRVKWKKSQSTILTFKWPVRCKS